MNEEKFCISKLSYKDIVSLDFLNCRDLGQNHLLTNFVKNNVDIDQGIYKVKVKVALNEK